jgi:hypothetical protein
MQPMLIPRIALVTALVWVSACSQETSRHKAHEAQKTTAVIGIEPLLFRCEQLASPEDVASALGGVVTRTEVAFNPPPGTAAPCHYLRTYESTQQPWSFDIDCRDDALKTARTLFEQYRNTLNEAGAEAVSVGREAMDHHGQALIFIDDDAPCYVRVNGPTAEGRLGLGKLIAERLRPETAPMRPRPAP